MKMQQIYYVSTGALNAMYTLRSYRRSAGFTTIDNYLCNLSTDYDKAEQKATEYVDAIRQRIASDSLEVLFYMDAPEEIMKRKGKLSVRDTQALEQLEEGIIPIGKNTGKKLADAQDGYIMFFADKAKEEHESVVFAAFCAACMGIALERNLIAKREAAKAERKAVDSLSNHVGTIGERKEFTGEVVAVFRKESQEDGSIYYINKIRVGNDIICYIGKELAAKGETITFKATIKTHKEYDGIKSTQVNRPAIKK